ncbi:MAG: hypothetical protein WCS31_17475 [Verrucomicrobiae bacterium]
MRLILDLDTRSFIESVQFQRVISSLVLKRRDRLPVDVQFLRGGTVVELAAGSTGKLGLKADKDFNGSFAASDLEWAKSGTGDATTYRFDLNLNTVQINALFAGVPTPASVALMLEIEWAEGDLRTSSNTLAVTLENDIVRGDEGVAEEGGPVYPLPGAIELIARKGQNNGYASLDETGKVPVSQLPPVSLDLRQEVTDDTARFALTTAQVQNGDFVYQTDTGILYQVTDQTNLANANGYTALATLAWGSVTGKPETFSPSSHTHAIGDVTGLQTALDGKAASSALQDAAGSIAEDGKQYARKNAGWVEVSAGPAAPIAISATANVKFGAAAGSGITHVLPAAPTSGDRAKYYITASGADRTFDMDSSIIPPSDSGLTLPKTLTSGKTYIVAFEYVVSQWGLSVVEGGYATTVLP